MLARSSRMSCSRQRASPRAARSFSARDSLARMSEAAARVKVTTSMRSTSAPAEAISRSTRSTSTVVLPEPAAAESRRSVPRASMAASCSSVQWGMSIPPIKDPLYSFPASMKYASTTTPRAMRYQPNALKSWVFM